MDLMDGADVVFANILESFYATHVSFIGFLCIRGAHLY